MPCTSSPSGSSGGLLQDLTRLTEGLEVLTGGYITERQLLARCPIPWVRDETILEIGNLSCELRRDLLWPLVGGLQAGTGLSGLRPHRSGGLSILDGPVDQ